MIATMKETANAIATVIGRAMMNSPAEPVRISSGRKEAMIVTVAVKTGTMTSLAHLQAASILRHLVVQELHVVVGDDDGVVHHDPQDHDQRRDGDLVQCDPQRVHHAERPAQGHRYGQGRDEGDAERKKEERDQDDGADGQQELVAQIRDPLLDDLRLVGDEVDLHVRRKEDLEPLEDLFQLLAELDDIFPLLHLDGKQEAGVAVVADHEVGVLVAARNRRRNP